MSAGNAGAMASGDVVPQQPLASINEQITAIALHPPLRRNWWIAFLISAALTGLLVISIGWLFIRGVGIWNINIPVNWSLAASASGTSTSR